MRRWKAFIRDKDEVTSIGSHFIRSRLTTSNRLTSTSCAATAQQSRLSMLAEANVSDHQKYASYLEFDFLGAAPTANSKESNSYTPRLRQFYVTGDDNPDGWHFLAGQSWSLVTMFKEGLIPRKENVPWTIDAQYVPGFDWLRNPEIRIVKDWDKKVWLGIEASSPQAIFGGNRGGGLAVQALTVYYYLPLQLAIGQCGFNNLDAGCTLDFMPDFTVKAAVDPGWGHYEIFGLARGFRDRHTRSAASR